jgi:hypothetical protein
MIPVTWGDIITFSINRDQSCDPFLKADSKNSNATVAKAFVVVVVGEECGWRRPSVKKSIWSVRKKSSVYKLTMLEDGMKELEKEEAIKIMDIAELVAKNMT